MEIKLLKKLNINIININKYTLLNMNNMFKDIDIPVPNIVFDLSEEKQKDIYEYLNQLDELQKKTYKIAFNHLGTSFNIYRSNGYKEWKNKE